MIKILTKEVREVKEIGEMREMPSQNGKKGNGEERVQTAFRLKKKQIEEIDKIIAESPYETRTEFIEDLLDIACRLYQGDYFLVDLPQVLTRNIHRMVELGKYDSPNHLISNFVDYAFNRKVDFNMLPDAVILDIVHEFLYNAENLTGIYTESYLEYRKKKRLNDIGKMLKLKTQEYGRIFKKLGIVKGFEVARWLHEISSVTSPYYNREIMLKVFESPDKIIEIYKKDRGRFHEPKNATLTDTKFLKNDGPIKL